MAFMQPTTLHDEAWACCDTVNGMQFIPSSVYGRLPDRQAIPEFATDEEHDAFLNEYGTTDEDELWESDCFYALHQYLDIPRDTTPDQYWSLELKSGWCARLSAPGYMDCTEWGGVYATEDEALNALCELHDICPDCAESTDDCTCGEPENGCAECARAHGPHYSGECDH